MISLCSFSSLSFGALKRHPGSKTGLLLTLLQLNDVYEIGPSENGKVGGLARVATLHKSIRAKNPNTLFVLAGDFLWSSVASQFFGGRQIVDVLSRAGVDVATLGNHEFDSGPEALKARMAEAGFAFVAANVVDKTTGELLGGASPSLIKEFGGHKVGVFGLLTPETRVLSSPGPTVEFLDPIEVARKAVAKLKSAGCELIVALTHMEMHEDRALAREVAGIDLILGGHDHDIHQEKIGSTLLFKAGANARHLGRLDIEIPEPNKGASVRVRRVTLIPVTADRVPEDREIAQVVQKYEGALSKQIDQPIAEIVTPIDARRETLSQKEAPLANLLADIYRETFKADIAIINGGNVRTEEILQPGPLTSRNVMKWLPYEDPLMTAEVPGRVLLKALEHGLSEPGASNNRFLHLSGASYFYDPSKPSYSRVVKVEVGGRPLDLNARYKIVLDRYILGGGDGFDFSEARVLMRPEDAVAKVPLVIEALRGKRLELKGEGRCEALLIDR